MKVLRELLAAAALAFTIFTVATNYSALPKRIPTHFDAHGAINGWGDKSTLWSLVAVVAFQYILLSLIRFFPQSMMNLPIRPEQRAAALPFGYAMADWIKAEVCCLFAFIVHSMLAAAKGHAQGPGLGFTVSLVAIFGTSIYYITRMTRVAATTPETL
jgi:uncharacterized membrane protein